MIDHLDKIYGEKKESVERYKKLYSVKDLSEKIKTYKNYYDFKKPLNNKKKVNLSVGVYQDNNGVTPTFESVLNAEKILLDKNYSKSYKPIDGDQEF